MNLLSPSPTFRPGSRAGWALLPWSMAPLEMWYAPKTWLACFLLATTKVTGGENLTATRDGDT